MIKKTRMKLFILDYMVQNIELIYVYTSLIYLSLNFKLQRRNDLELILKSM